MSAGELCRMCGKMTESGISLMHPANMHIAQCIVTNFRYMITSNIEFPRYICLVCAEELKDWVYFLERCKKSQTQFSTVLAAEKLKKADTPIKQDPDGLSQVTVCPPDDPLLSASELKIAAKFPELKVASVPVARLDQKEIEKFQQPDNAKQHEAKLYENMQVHPKYSCQLCEKKNIRLTQFIQHLTKTHHLSEEEVLKYVPEFYECKYCHRQFKRPSLLHSHVGSHTLPFKCDICDKRFGWKGDLKKHKLIHSEPQLPCPHCVKKFRQNSDLKLHIERQHSGGVRKYKCDQCNKKYKTKKDLYIHVKLVHCAQSERLWKCDECGKCFKCKEYLCKHKMCVHSAYKYFCAHCDKKFKLKFNLKRHIETQHSGGVRKYKCNLCKKKFKSSQYRSTHIRFVHAPPCEMIWKCDECGKRFKCKRYLKLHKVNVHSGYKYSCVHCQRKFKQSGHLKFHIGIHHSGGADHCKKKFKTKSFHAKHI